MKKVRETFDMLQDPDLTFDTLGCPPIFSHLFLFFFKPLFLLVELRDAGS